MSNQPVPPEHPPARPMPAFPMSHVVWQAGRVITILIDPTEPPAEFEIGTHKTAHVYLVAPVDVNTPQDTAADDPPFIPQHDEVLDSTLGGHDDRRAPAGFYVLRGPHATPDNVQSRVDPKGAWGTPGEPGAALELAYAIDLGVGMTPLRSSELVEAGVERGLLSLLGVPSPPMGIPHPGSVWVASLARDTTPDHLLRDRRETIVRQHIYAESHGDVVGAVAAFARASYDVVPLAESPDAPMTHPTPADVHAHLSGFLGAFPDLELIILRLHHADEAVIVEGRMIGTQSNTWGDLPPTNRKMDSRAAIFYRFEGDQMVNETAYFDMAGILRQLGVTG